MYRNTQAQLDASHKDHHHHRHLGNMALGHFLTRSGHTSIEDALIFTPGLFCLLVCSFQYKVKRRLILQPVLPNCHPHILTVHSVPTNEGMTTESQRYNCFIRNTVNAILNKPVQRLTVEITATDFPCSGLVTHSG